jgi:transcriptional regulator with XRE-family HTH domain
MSKIEDTREGWGAHLRALREARGWTQRDLEEICGVSRSRISQIERDEDHSPGLDVLLRLQSAFGLDSIEALLGRPPSAVLAHIDVGRPRG